MNTRVFSILSVLCALATLAGCDLAGDVEVTPKHSEMSYTPASLAPSSGSSPNFSRDVGPLLGRYCLHCHDRATAAGRAVLDDFNDGALEPKHKSLLRRVAANLRSETMPPAGEPRPNADELETIHSWLDTVLFADGRPATRLAIRRLNRSEYNNTIRDLLGVDVRPADDFPSDDVGYGFDNIGDVLSTPPILLEMYLATAEKVVTLAFESATVRECLMNPPVDTVPRAFRKYIPPVRSPRNDKTLRTVSPAPDPELERQQFIYNVLLSFCDRAFRRPATHDEITRLLGVVLSAQKDGERTEFALQLAFRAVLVSPHFLFLHNKPDPVATGNALPTNDFDLASRLSYFLWSSMPDEPLFRLAAQGVLRRPEILRVQVKRMLRDQKARAFAENFASQWLQTRTLESFTPDPVLFPDFDEPLRAAMLAEPVAFFESIRDNDRSVLDFLDADYTFVNERLARHYGIAGIAGESFRRVSLAGTPRGGVLTQASVLAATSNPNRTSAVKRGKWILENILGAPPAPPPSGVEALKEGKNQPHASTLRQRMEQHRKDPACASCHRTMDPLGFGLENFNVIGAWRTHDNAQSIDSSGQLPGGEPFQGPAELKALLRAHREAFVRCLTEKMLTDALGRGLDRADRRAVNQIVASLARNDDRFSALIFAVVESEPFLNTDARSWEGDLPSEPRHRPARKEPGPSQITRSH